MATHEMAFILRHEDMKIVFRGPEKYGMRLLDMALPRKVTEEDVARNLGIKKKPILADTTPKKEEPPKAPTPPPQVYTPNAFRTWWMEVNPDLQPRYARRNTLLLIVHYLTQCIPNEQTTRAEVLRVYSDMHWGPPTWLSQLSAAMRPKYFTAPGLSGKRGYYTLTTAGKQLALNLCHPKAK